MYRNIELCCSLIAAPEQIASVLRHARYSTLVASPLSVQIRRAHGSRRPAHCINANPERHTTYLAELQAFAARKQVRKFRRFCEAEEVERSPLGNVLRMSVPREERSAGRAGPAFKRLPARLRGLPQVDRPCEIAVRRPGTGLHINGVSSKAA